MNWMIPTPWGPIPIHFCQDEARMLAYGVLGALPFVGSFFFWVRSKFKKAEKQHEKCCPHD